MSVGHSPSEPQWTPDMRKNEDQITEEDKKNAERRIRGGLSEESPDESGGDEAVVNTANVINDDATVRL